MALSAQELKPAEVISETVYTLPPGATLHLSKAIGPGLALWVRRRDGVDIYLSSAGVQRFDGYWMEGKGEVASRTFVTPQGDISLMHLGKSIVGKFTFWAPAPNAQYKDFSGELRWSRDGGVATMTGYEDGATYAYRNGESYGPYTAIPSHFPTPSGDILYVARTVEGDIRVFRNGEDLSGPIPDARIVVARESLVDGGGYVFGVLREAGFWLMHNDKVIAGEDVIADVVIPDRAGPLAYMRRIDNQIELVIGGVPVGERFDAASPVTFSADGRHYAMTGQRKTGDGRAQPYFLVDGNLIGPFDVGALAGYRFAGESGPFAYGYVDKGETHVLFGEERIGRFAAGDHVPSPRTSPDGRHYAIYRGHPDEPLLRSAERTVKLQSGDQVIAYDVDDRGDLHATVQRGDAQVRLFNDAVIGTFGSIPIGEFSIEQGEFVFVGAGEDGQTLFRGRTAAYTADRFVFARFVKLAGKDRLVARILRDGREYLVIDDRIAGPFDEVLLERVSLDGKQADGFVFHSRTGNTISRHDWSL
ncbi:MAG: hypothetical protein ACFCUO_01575 [Rhodospirillales bacterium]